MLNLSEFSINGTTPLIYNCNIGNNKYSIECISRLICPQLNNHFWNTGLFIVIIYFIMAWLIWYYFAHGWKIYPMPNNQFFGDFNNIQTRAYWELWINRRITNIMFIYICMILFYLSRG